MNILFQNELFIHYGQFYIDEVDTDDLVNPEDAFVNQHNGIIGAAQKNKLFLVTGSSDALIDLTLEHHDHEPEINNDFDEICEVSLQVKNPIQLCEWAWESTYDLALPLDNYRARYFIKNMHLDYDENSDWEKPIPNQKYVIQLWSAEPSADAIIKVTSDIAKYWHKEWGNS